MSLISVRVIFYFGSLIAAFLQDDLILTASFSFSPEERQFNVHQEWKAVAFNLPSLYSCVRYRTKYLKRRFLYGINHSGSYNPAIISNQEAHMMNGNINPQQGLENRKVKKAMPRQPLLIFSQRPPATLVSSIYSVVNELYRKLSFI